MQTLETGFHLSKMNFNVFGIYYSIKLLKFGGETV